MTTHVVFGANDLAKIYDEKVKQRDDLLMSAFGFTRMMTFSGASTKEEGIFKASAQDILEKEEQDKVMDEIQNEMGSEEEQKALAVKSLKPQRRCR